MDPDPSRTKATLASLLAAKDARSARAAEGMIDAALRVALAERRTQRAGSRASGPGDLIRAAYARLFGRRDLPREARARFFRVSAKSLRRLLVEQARGEWPEADVWIASALRDDLEAAEGARPGLVLALDGALSDLEREDGLLGALVELHGFAGLKLEEMADVCALGPENVARDWSTARAWLRRTLGAEWCGAV